MIINKVIQELAKRVSSEKNIRPALSSVFFTKNKAVATDSFKICEIEFLENEFTPDDLVIENFEYKKFNEDILISKDIITKINIPKSDNIKIFNNVFIGNINENTVDLVSTDLDKRQTVKTKIHQGKFPDYEVFFPETFDIEIGVGVDNLIELLQVYKKAKVRGIKIRIGKPLDPIVILTNAENSNTSELGIKEIKSIVMPIKL